MTFRYAVLDASHGEAWKALHLQGVRDFPIGFLLTLAEAEATSPERCREILEAGQIRGLFDSAALVAFCGFRRQRLALTRHRAEIGPFFVARSHHGHGAAQALMRGVIEEATTLGVGQLELSVDTENARAIRFYGKRPG